MTTITQEWKSYKQGAYPDGMSPDQERQMFFAFLAGCQTLTGLMHNAATSSDNEDEAMVKMQNVDEELRVLVKTLILNKGHN